MLVPEKNAKHGGALQSKLGTLEYTLTPGATTSGLILPCGCPLPWPASCSTGGPMEEKLASMSALDAPVRKYCGTVPSTVTMLGATAAIARPLLRETITAGMVGWLGVPS